MTTSDREVVAALERAIAQRIGEPRYKTWFAQHTEFMWQGETLSVGVPNHFFQEWLESKFGDAVRAAAAEVADGPVAVRFFIDAELFQAARREEAAVTAPNKDQGQSESHVKQRRHSASADRNARGTTDEPAQRAASKRSRQWKRLTDFVVGTSNRVAHAAAVSVVETPGQESNPLVLHGPVGTGKTHLLEGLYFGLRKTHPDERIVFITSEEFTNRFVQAMRFGKLSGFRRSFRDCDTLLMDDVQFLAKKRATQEEFLHTVDVLLAEGRQLVVTCDCHPKLAEEFTPELGDRLLGGAVWGLTPPDDATRLEILRSKARRADVRVSDDVLQLLAQKLRGNVRELEGAIYSLRHYSVVANRPVDTALAQEALGELLRHSVRVLLLEDVDRAVCKAMRLEDGALQCRQRAWAVSHPRMMAMFLARKHTSAAYSEIGQHFGGRNHSTVVAAERKVRQWVEDDAELALGDRKLRVRDLVALAERELRR